VPKTETMPPEPVSPYAMTKLDGEFYGALFARDKKLATVSLRYFNVFGPRPGRRDEEHAKPFIRQILRQFNQGHIDAADASCHLQISRSDSSGPLLNPHPLRSTSGQKSSEVILSNPVSF
jgi:hypothetical protein